MDATPVSTTTTESSVQPPRSLLLNPPLWLVLGILVIAAAVSPLDWPLRTLVGPETRADSPVITAAGVWHHTLYQLIHFAYLYIIPPTLWTLIIIALPTAKTRWKGAGIVLTGFALRGLFEFLKAHGQSWVALLDSSLPMIVLLFLLGLFPNGKLMWYAYFIPVALSQVITHFFKLTIGRVRPKLAEHAFEFHPLHQWEGDYSSFPSGHTSAATAMALLLAVYIPRFRWIFAILALIVGAERIVTNAHWLSDVIGGVAIGLTAIWIGRRLFSPEHYVSDRAMTKTP